MPERDLAVRMKADASGLVGEVDRGTDSFDRMGGAVDDLKKRAGDYVQQQKEIIQKHREQTMVVKDAANDVKALGAGYGIAAAGVAVFVAATVLGMIHYERTARALNEIEIRLAATGRQGMQTRIEIAALVEQLARMPGMTQASAQETVSALASVPGIAGPLFRELAGIVDDFSIATGKQAPEAARELARSFADPVRGSRALAQELGILNAEQMLLIESLARQGRLLDAQDVLFAALQGRVKGLHEQGVTPLQRATNDLSNAFSELWRRFADSAPVGIALGGLAFLIQKAAQFVQIDRAPAAVAGGRTFEQQLAEQDRAILASIDNQVQAALKAGEAYDGLAVKLQHLRELQTQLQLAVPLAGGGAAAERLQRQLAAVNFEFDKIKGLDPASVQARAELAASERAAEENRRNAFYTGTELSQRRGIEQAGIGAMTDPQARARAQLDFEARLRRESIENAGLEIDQKKRQLDQFGEWRVARERELNEQLKPEYQKNLDAWSDTNRLMRDNWNRTMLSMQQAGEDLFVQFVRTGKVNIRDLTNVMETEMARSFYRAMAGLGGSSSSGINWSSIAGLVGGLFTSGGGSPNNAQGGDYGVFLHEGGVVGSGSMPMRRVPAGTFRGAPRLHSGLAGDEFPAILQRGETVLPRGSSGTSINSTLNFNINAPGADADTVDRMRAMLMQDLPGMLYKHRRALVGLVNNHRRESGRDPL